MKMIQDFNFKGKKAIVRVDFNVPLDKKTFTVTDDTRIRGALLTINKIINDGGCLILMSHLGRPEGRMEKYSLKPVLPVLERRRLGFQRHVPAQSPGPDAVLHRGAAIPREGHDGRSVGARSRLLSLR